MKKIFAISILLISAMVLFPVCGNAQIATGNWYLKASTQLSDAGTSQIPQIGGSLKQTGTTISGVLHISDSDCFDWGVSVPVSGTVNGATVSLTSNGANGEVITITGSVNSNVITGNYSIQGGCAQGDHGMFTAVLLSPSTGSWSGVVTSGGAQSNAAASLSQALPNSDGFSLLTGTVTLAGSQCSAIGTLANEKSWVLGNVVQAVVVLNNGGVMSLNGFITDVSPAAKKMTVNFDIDGGSCAGQNGSVTFSR